MEEEIDINDLIVALWRKKILILIVTLVFFVIGVGLYYKNNKTDENINSNTKIDIMEENIDNGYYIESEFIFSKMVYKEFDGSLKISKLNIDSNIITILNTFAKSDNFLKNVFNELDINNIEIKDFKNNIVIVNAEKGDILTLVVIYDDKEKAIEISNKIMVEIKDKLTKLYDVGNIELIDGPKELDEDEVQVLFKKINSIEENSDEIKNVEKTKSPKKKIILVTAVGFVCVCGCIVVAELFNKSVKDIEQLEKATRSKTLVTIPKTNFDLSDKFNLLRVNLNNYKTVLVTSPENNDGKSFVSMNLAKSFAKSDKKTLIINSNYLFGNKFEKDLKVSDINNLTIAKIDSSENSETNDSIIEKRLKELEEIYDVIIVDSDNILESAKTLTIAKLVKNAVLVIAERKTKLENCIRAKNNIEDIGGNVIGNVLNKTIKK